MHHRLEGVKRTAAVNAQRSFSSVSKELQYDIFDKMQAEGLIAERRLNDPSYQQNVIRKALTSMLDSSMATMYKDAMSRAVETDF